MANTALSWVVRGPRTPELLGGQLCKFMCSFGLGGTVLTSFQCELVPAQLPLRLGRSTSSAGRLKPSLHALLVEIAAFSHNSLLVNMSFLHIRKEPGIFRRALINCLCRRHYLHVTI